MNHPWRKLSGVPDRVVKKVASRGLPQNDNLLKPYITNFLTPKECEHIVTLTDDYTHGDLEFMAYDSPDDEKATMRSQGTAIVFPSFLNHRVRPVSSGVRRSMVAWIAGPPFS